MRHLVTAALIVLSGTAVALAQSGAAPLSPTSMPYFRADLSGTKQSVDELRRAGPSGLRTILTAYNKDPKSVSVADIDAVAGQHDALWSRLYWYTDLDAAKAAARAEHKPILYLRLLGKLTDEYSCANSRFFRTVLYANSNVSKLLRERFVLVWSSERPVPVVTIDFGDGRTLKRTITGNSIHYVLDADGRVIDALPGLYDPVKFAEILATASDVAASSSVESRRSYWELAGAVIASEWARDTKESTPVPSVVAVNADKPLVADAMPRAMSKSGIEGPLVRAAFPAAARNEIPSAAEAADRALGKSMVESPLLARLSESPARAELSSVSDAGAVTWARIAEKHLADARLDANSLALIRSQNPVVYSDSQVLNRTVDQFQRSIAEDTVRNNYRFRSQVLGWLHGAAASGPTESINLETLNAWVYADLFLTPRSDPWLGLLPEFTYSGLTSDECAQSANSFLP